jgi:hypothetical protein
MWGHQNALQLFCCSNYSSESNPNQFIIAVYSVAVVVWGTEVNGFVLQERTAECLPPEHKGRRHAGTRVGAGLPDADNLNPDRDRAGGRQPPWLQSVCLRRCIILSWPVKSRERQARGWTDLLTTGSWTTTLPRDRESESHEGQPRRAGDSSEQRGPAAEVEQNGEQRGGGGIQI